MGYFASVVNICTAEQCGQGLGGTIISAVTEALHAMPCGPHQWPILSLSLYNFETDKARPDSLAYWIDRIY